MYIESVPNRNSPPAILLRESYRLDGKVKKRTLANLSKWPDELVEGLRTLLKGGVALPSIDAAFEIVRALPHGHVAAVLGTLRKVGLERLIDRVPSRQRDLVVAMIAARILEPRSKLATARGLASETAHHTLAEELGVEDASASDLYEAMDWLLVKKLRDRFGLDRVVVVGDRGLITSARIEEDLKPAGLAWLSALRAPAIRTLAEQGHLQLSLFDQRDMAEISAPELYPGERLIVCKNPLLANERTRKRLELLDMTDRLLEDVDKATKRRNRPLRGKENIAVRVDRAKSKYKVGKHYDIEIADDGFKWRRNQDRIDQEAAMDGFYVIRTNVPKDELPAEGAVRSYKSLSRVERAFRSLKSVDLKVRPVHHRLADRVKAHVLLCTLAYYVEWHMRKRLAPILFDDHAKTDERESLVQPAKKSDGAKRKANSGRTEDGLPVHSFQTLLQDLATLTRNHVRVPGAGTKTANVLVRPTPLQETALSLLDVRL